MLLKQTRWEGRRRGGQGIHLARRLNPGELGSSVQALIHSEKQQENGKPVAVVNSGLETHDKGGKAYTAPGLNLRLKKAAWW